MKNMNEPRLFDLQLFAEGEPPAGDPPATPPATPPAGDPPAAPPATPPATPPGSDPPAGDPPATPPATPLETYEKFTLPEGATYDDNLHTSFTAVAKKHNLTQEAAQEFVTMYAGIKQQEQQSLLTEHEQRIEQWVNDAKADPLIAKDFDKNRAIAKEVYKRFGGDELVELLDGTGFGSHPLLIKLGMAVMEKVGDDNFPDGKSSSGDKQSIGNMFFPNSK